MIPELRILLAGLLGGIVIFFMGAMNHMVLSIGDRSIHNIPSEKGIVEAIRAEKLEHGIYRFPYIDEKAMNDEKVAAEWTEKYKQGPNGMLIIGRTNEEPMDGGTLGMEFGSNALFALLAAWVVSRFGAGSGFLHRWLAVVLMGLAAWLSLSASLHIWYRFHWDYVRDELYCTLIECVVGGLVIAALTWPAKAMPKPESSK